MSADLAETFGIDDRDAKPTDLTGWDCRGCGHPEEHHNTPDGSCSFATLCNCRGWNVPVGRVDASCAGCGDPMRAVPEEAEDAKCSTCLVREVRNG